MTFSVYGVIPLIFACLIWHNIYIFDIQPYKFEYTHVYSMLDSSRPVYSNLRGQISNIRFDKILIFDIRPVNSNLRRQISNIRFDKILIFDIRGSGLIVYSNLGGRISNMEILIFDIKTRKVEFKKNPNP